MIQIVTKTICLNVSSGMHNYYIQESISTFPKMPLVKYAGIILTILYNEQCS